jgi:hypothetical protein
MRATTLGLTIFGAVLLAGSAAGPATAGLDVDLGAAVRIGDDTDLYFAISSRYFDRDRREVEHWGGRSDNLDDLAVALFIAGRSGRSPDFLLSLRRDGLSWWEIGIRVGLPVDAWFVPVDRDPGPPYGNAYGHWKHHKKKSESKKSRSGYVLTDADARNLVAVRMIHDYYGVSVEVAMEWRSSGRELRVLLAEEYQRRHGRKDTPPGQAKKDSVATAHGKGKGKTGH